MELADNKLMIPDLKTHVFDSELLVTEGVLTFGDERPTMRFAFDIANTDLKQALETLVGYTLITGRGSITGSVAMSGKNISEWIDSMEGSARIYARAVSIKGMDFDLLGKKMGALKELEDIRYWSHRALTTGKTYVDFLTASIAVRRGKLFFENISATQARIVNYTIELIADLARWTLEGKINLSVRTNEQKSIPIPVAITLAGDLSNPYVTWDKSLYEQYWEQKYFRY